MRYRLWLIVLMAFLGFLLETGVGQAETLQRMTLDGVEIEYSVPERLEPELSVDGTSLSNAAPPVVMVANPTPSPAPVRVPPPQASLARMRSSSLEASTAATFSMTYAPAGSTDPWGASCGELPAQVRTVFETVGAIWGSLLQSPVPIKISACWSTSLSGGTLGYSSATTFHRNFSNAPRTNVWFAAALANSLAGSDLNPSEVDIYITYNANFSWYLGTDGNTPISQYDLLSVVLHEIGHGLNFSGSIDYASGTAGWGYGTGAPTIYDTFLYDASGRQIVNTGVYANPSTSLGGAVTSSSLWFRGSNAMDANGGQPVKIYAPSIWQPGSSYAHLDYNAFKNGLNRLMVYALAAGDSIHNPGPVALGLLKDLGWNAPSAPEPANNAFANATVITGVSGQATGSNVGASKEAGEPSHAGKIDGRSIWWRWTPAASGQVVIDTFGSDFDTLLGVYTGSSVAALTAVASNDDYAIDNVQSQASFSATAGVAYYIAVDGYLGGSGDIVLNWLQTPNPTTGSLSVSIQPATVASFTDAQWAVDGGVWRTSGATATGLSAGSHTISFKNVAGWTAPRSQSVTVTAGQTTAVVRTYVRRSLLLMPVLQLMMDPGSR